MNELNDDNANNVNNVNNVNANANNDNVNVNANINANANNMNALYSQSTHTRLSLGLAIHARHAVSPYDEPRISFEVDRIKVPSNLTGEFSNLVNVAYLWSGVPITRRTLYHTAYTEEELIELLFLGWTLDIKEDTFKFKLDGI